MKIFKIISLLIIASVVIFLSNIKSYNYAQEKEEGCLTSKCHSDIKAFKNKHAILDPCETCHTLEGDTFNKDKHKYTLNAEGKALCFMCHEDFEKDKLIKHVEKSGDSCTMCHNPHGSNTKPLLTHETTKELCTMCHGEEYTSKKFKHGPIQSDDCTSCHNPHASIKPKLLASSVKNLCSMCHGDMKEEFKKAKSVHMPAKLNCTSCHDPHNSDYEMYLKKPLNQLCLTCHKKAIKEKVYKIVKIKNSESNKCINCHASHYSSFPKLIKKQMNGPCLVLK